MSRARAQVLVGRAMQPPAQPVQRMSVAEATASCQAAMARVSQLQRQAHVPSTVNRRQATAAEAQSFFDGLPAEWGEVSLSTAGPEHVLWFAIRWLQGHVGKFYAHAVLAGVQGYLQTPFAKLPQWV